MGTALCGQYRVGDGTNLVMDVRWQAGNLMGYVQLVEDAGPSVRTQDAGPSKAHRPELGVPPSLRLAT